MPEEFLTVEEVTGYLKLARITVYRMLARREISTFKVGRQWRFYRKTIDAWLMKNSNIPKERLH